MKSKALSIVLLAASIAGIAWSSSAAGDGSLIPAVVAGVSMLVGVADIVLFTASGGSALAKVLAVAITLGLVAAAAGLIVLSLSEGQEVTSPEEVPVAPEPAVTGPVAPAGPETVPAPISAEPESPAVKKPARTLVLTQAELDALLESSRKAEPAVEDTVAVVPAVPIIEVRTEPVEEPEAPVALVEETAELLEEVPEAVVEAPEAVIEEEPEVAEPVEAIEEVAETAEPVEAIEEVAETAEPVEAIEEVAETAEPVVISETLFGYTITVAVLDGTAVVSYPSVVTIEDAELFYAYENAKYGDALDGITYRIAEGSTTFSVPLPDETIIANVPVFFLDIVEYVNMLLAEAEASLIVPVETIEVIAPETVEELPEIVEETPEAVVLPVEAEVPDAPVVDVRSVELVPDSEVPDEPEVEVRSIELVEEEVPDAPEVYNVVYLED